MLAHVASPTTCIALNEANHKSKGRLTAVLLAVVWGLATLEDSVVGSDRSCDCPVRLS